MTDVLKCPKCARSECVVAGENHGGFVAKIGAGVGGALGFFAGLFGGGAGALASASAGASIGAGLGAKSGEWLGSVASEDYRCTECGVEFSRINYADKLAEFRWVRWGILARRRVCELGWAKGGAVVLAALAAVALVVWAVVSAAMWVVGVVFGRFWWISFPLIIIAGGAWLWRRYKG